MRYEFAGQKVYSGLGEHTRIGHAGAAVSGAEAEWTMNPSGLTSWGAKLLYVRGLCGGVILSALIAPKLDARLIFVVALVLTFSGLITPILRALGWRRLVEHTQNAPTGPFPDEVEHALRAILNDGMSVHEAVRLLRCTKGWDVLHLYPAVMAIAGLPEKEAIRLALSTVLPGPTESANQVA